MTAKTLPVSFHIHEAYAEMEQERSAHSDASYKEAITKLARFRRSLRDSAESTGYAARNPQSYETAQEWLARQTRPFAFIADQFYFKRDLEAEIAYQDLHPELDPKPKTWDEIVQMFCRDDYAEIN